MKKLKIRWNYYKDENEKKKIDIIIKMKTKWNYN